jgi:hypothetical protein
LLDSCTGGAAQANQSDAFVLAAFACPGAALRAALEVEAGMREAAWPRALLAHPLAEPVVLWLRRGGGGSGGGGCGGGVDGSGGLCSGGASSLRTATPDASLRQSVSSLNACSERASSFYSDAAVERSTCLRTSLARRHAPRGRVVFRGPRIKAR